MTLIAAYCDWSVRIFPVNQKGAQDMAEWLDVVVKDEDGNELIEYDVYDVVTYYEDHCDGSCTLSDEFYISDVIADECLNKVVVSISDNGVEGVYSTISGEYLVNDRRSGFMDIEVHGTLPSTIYKYSLERG